MQPGEKKEVLVRIVDDDPAVRDAESFMLRCKGWKTAVYPSASEFLTSDAPGVPGCLVLDIRMPGMTGLELQERMAERGIGVPIIFLTGHATVDTAVDTMKKGAVDFLQKPVENERLLAAIERACSASLARSRGELAPEELRAELARLSPREGEILGLIAEGVQNRAIAERLGLSERTVQGHRNNLYKRLRVHSEKEILAALERAGIRPGS
ncbi:MAG: response regulator [Sutterellaceae bacterium]|nr:response regulator [Sutterellaceae bacterium]MDD7441188.1 response regulator [Sutterellaceae bacterium]MDY2868836.1 response regulator [Mesosutterella sp.]